MKYFTYFFILFALFGLIAPPGAQAADPKALLDELKRSYASTRDLTAHFTQSTTLKAVEMERVTKGTATFKKGGRVRWSYEGDDPQEIVCDGATLWVHQVRDRTVIKRKVSELSPAGRVALDLLGGFEGVSEQFTLGSCGERCVELTPRRPDPDLAKVRVELAPEGGAVKSVGTEDPVGNVTRVEFSDLRTNTGVSDAVFAFTPPSGTDVVESGLEAPK